MSYLITPETALEASALHSAAAQHTMTHREDEVVHLIIGGAGGSTSDYKCE